MRGIHKGSNGDSGMVAGGGGEEDQSESWRERGGERKSERRKAQAGLYRQRQQSAAKSERETKLDREAVEISQIKDMASVYRATVGNPPTAQRITP